MYAADGGQPRAVVRATEKIMEIFFTIDSAHSGLVFGSTFSLVVGPPSAVL